MCICSNFIYIVIIGIQKNMAGWEDTYTIRFDDHSLIYIGKYLLGAMWFIRSIILILKLNYISKSDKMAKLFFIPSLKKSKFILLAECFNYT